MPDTETVVGAAVVLGIVALLGAGLVSFAQSGPGDQAAPDVATFDSEQEFRSYLNQPRSRDYLEADAGSLRADADAQGGDGPRFSRTNVQESGIMEADRLTSTGRYSFYATGDGNGSVKIVDVSAPKSPTVVNSLPVSGQLLRSGDTLIVLNDEAVYGYDISDPESPEQRWTRSFGNESAPVTSRLRNGSVYLVVSTAIDTEDPCPIAPFEDGEFSVGCTDTHHPTKPASVDATYTTMALAPESGTVEDSASIVGAVQGRTIYVSDEAVYLSYLRKTSQQSDNRSEGGLLSGVAEESADVATPLRTGIVRVRTTGDMDVTAVGEVPGVPLNQFSLKAADGHLRIATTTTDRRNRLFVLDENLSVVGKVTDIASGQRLTGVRHVGDTAYAVTFLRKDPFHVIDVSDPNDPTERGRVELPGVSRYLHPVGDDRVIGVGSQDRQVKLTLFDASDPKNPRVADELLLTARSTAVLDSHHAFLEDPAHDTIVIPASDAGHVVSYGTTLRVAAKIDTTDPARRAMYVGDYYHLYTDERVVVVETGNWTREGAATLHPA